MKKLTAESIKNALSLLGWKEDTYGHMQCVSMGGTKYRVKMQATSVRLEVKRDMGTTTEWVRVESSYIKDVVINDGSVVIGKAVLKIINKG
jgi:hypothetical protein